ncbi:MAG TPA: hypothetical protein VGX23_35410 [Actinocrinis sp.]|nr:hypothetical protein [Actinocrinis sp.]
MLLTSPNSDPRSTFGSRNERRWPLDHHPALRFTVILAASWLGPAAATSVHAAWILPPAMLVFTAGALRAGTMLLDRLMFALLTMLGAVLALALLYSVWPWHLDPVATAGSYLSLIATAAALSGREFQIPRGVKGSDLLLLSVSVFTFVKLYQPIARLTPIQRFAFTTPLEDEITHFGFYDAIHSNGGYGFLRSSVAFPFVGSPSQLIYPQGAHLLYVLTDVFARSTTQSGNGVAEYNRFFVETMVGYAFLVLAVGWSARWLAGPRLRGWHEALVCAVVLGLAAFGPLGFVFRTADVAEVVGLALVAMLTAVVMRAPRQIPDQLLLTAAAVIALSYVYYAFLVMILPALLVGFVVYRRRLRRHRRFASLLAVVTIPIAALPMVIVETTSFSAQAQAGAPGAKSDISRELLAALFLIVLASQFTRVGRRSPTWRMTSVNLVLCLAGLAALVVVQGGGVINTSYYAEKLVYVLFLLCLLGISSCTLFLKPVRKVTPRAQAPERLSARLIHSAFLPSAALAVAVLALGSVNVSGSHAPSASEPAWLGYWSTGHVQYPDEPVLAALAQRGLLTDGVQTLVATSNVGYYDYRLSRLVGALNHQEARTELLGTLAFTNLDDIDSAAADPGGKVFQADLGLLLDGITTHSGRVRIVLANQDVAGAVTAYAHRHPGLLISVVILPAADAGSSPI